jgi:hypothetical protein
MIGRPKVGEWFDFRSGKGGDAIELICACKPRSFRCTGFRLRVVGDEFDHWQKRQGQWPRNGASHPHDTADKLANALTIARQSKPAKDTGAVDHLAPRGLTSGKVL